MALPIVIFRLSAGVFLGDGIHDRGVGNDR